MTTMTLETAKARAMDYIPSKLLSTACGSVLPHFAILHIVENGAVPGTGRDARSPMRLFADMALKQARDIISRWDARCVADLVKLVPHAYPAWVATGQYDVEYGDSGWVLVKRGNA